MNPQQSDLPGPAQFDARTADGAVLRVHAEGRGRPLLLVTGLGGRGGRRTGRRHCPYFHLCAGIWAGKLAKRAPNGGPVARYGVVALAIWRDCQARKSWASNGRQMW